MMKTLAKNSMTTTVEEGSLKMNENTNSGINREKCNEFVDIMNEETVDKTKKVYEDKKQRLPDEEKVVIKSLLLEKLKKV